MEKDPNLESPPRCFSLIGLAYERLSEIKIRKESGIIPLPHVFSKLCSSFSVPKKDAWHIIFNLADMGLIIFIPYHGIKIVQLKDLENGKR